MPTIIEERFESASIETGKNPAVELRYWIKGTEDGEVAHADLASHAPTSFIGLVRNSVHVEPEGRDLWAGTVRYEAAAFGGGETGSSSFSFETGGGTQRVTQSKETIAKYAPPDETAPDHKGAIGVTESGVEGVEIVAPVYQFSETHYKADADVDQAYKLAVFELTGKVNDDAFRGFAAGEVLFLGASGAQRLAPDGSDDWEITYRFAASKNATGLSVGDITGIDKEGWEYLWVQYREAADETAHSIVRRPIAAYVERVYDAGDFSVLELG